MMATMANNKKTFFLAVHLLLMGVAVAQRSDWPKGRKAAIVLTYDDALQSQLTHAVPQLLHYKLRATFFITGALRPQDVVVWRKVAKAGFELGNHTLYHPCYAETGNLVDAARYTTAAMLQEIEVMNVLLTAIDDRPQHAFAYPCFDTLAGSQSYVAALRRQNNISYARLGGEDSVLVSAGKNLDFFKVPALAVDSATQGPELIGFVDSVKQAGALGVLVFHGVGGDYLAISSEAHEQLLNYLAKHRKTIWTAGFTEAMDYLRRRSGHVQHQRKR